MSEHPAAGRYFERRGDLVLADGEIVVAACLRDERQRLPFFLDYYRGLGVDRFLLIDNDSTDGSREFLAEQSDVALFHTSASFSGSSAGREWVHEVAETYALGHWVIAADIDELLVYPGVEMFGVHDLCRYLDQRGYEGLFAVMLDMYSDRPLAQTIYEPGDDFRDACPFFEVDSYRLKPAGIPPFVGVTGGPRSRLLTGPTAADVGSIQQRKVPLVKWREGFSYVAVAHSSRYVPLADVTGALLHFKYFSTWEDRVKIDHVRGDRIRSLYAFYKDHVGGDLCFYGNDSLRYHSSGDLVRLGVLATSVALRRFYDSELEASGQEHSAIDALLPAQIPEVGVTLRSVASLWPFAHNPLMARYFGQLTLSQRQRAHVVQDLSEDVGIVDVQSDHVLIRLARKALHGWHRQGIALATYVDDKLVGHVAIDGTATELELQVDALVSSVFRWNLDVGAAAGTNAPVALSCFVVDTTNGAPGPRPGGDDVLVLERPWAPQPAEATERTRFNGVVNGFADGGLRGWVYDAELQTFDVPVSIFLDGRLAAYERPNVRRASLAEKLQCPPTVIGRGFMIPIPVGFLRDAGLPTARVEVRVAGSHLDLRRTPFDLPTDADSLQWRAGAWIATGRDGPAT